MSYGIFLSFHSKEAFLKAVSTLKNASWEFETFTPYAVQEVLKSDDALGPHPLSPVKLAGLGGALLGIFTGFFMQWFASVKDTPLNSGGRPLNSWPSFIPVTWILMVLFSGVSVYFSLWWTLKLPKPYHPVFNAKAFSLTQNHFGILIHDSLTGPSSDFLSSLHADTQEVVPC